MPSLIQFIQYLLFHITERRKNMSIAKKAALGRQSNLTPTSNGRAISWQSQDVLQCERCSLQRKPEFVSSWGKDSKKSNVQFRKLLLDHIFTHSTVRTFSQSCPQRHFHLAVLFLLNNASLPKTETCDQSLCLPDALIECAQFCNQLWCSFVLIATQIVNSFNGFWSWLEFILVYADSLVLTKYTVQMQETQIHRESLFT